MAKTTEPFTVPFAYPVPYLPRSCTETRTAQFASQVDLSLRIVEPVEAPVAFKVASPPEARNDYHRLSFPPKRDGSPREVRWHDSRFWVEWGPADDFVSLLKGMDSAFDTPFSYALNRKPFVHVPAPVEEKAGALYRKRPVSKSPSGIQTRESVKALEGVIKTMEDDGGVSKAAELRAAADTCIIVDGIVFEETPEPVLCVEKSWGKVSVQPAPDANRHMSFGGHGYGTTSYRLDQLDEALAVAMRAEHRETKKPFRTPQVEILIPGLVMADPDGGRCMKAVRNIEKELTQVARDLPRSWAGPVAAFGRLAAMAPRLPSPALAEALEGLAELDLPDAAQSEQILRLARRRGRGHETERMLESLPDISKAAKAAAPEARRLAGHYAALPGRLDPSVCTLLKDEGGISRFRLRQARAPEDFRRAACLIGRGMEDLLAEVDGDGDMDVVVVERCTMDGLSGRDMSLLAVNVVDLSTGMTRVVAGDMDEPMVSEALDAHLDEAWPGRRPSPDAGPGGPR